MRNCWAWPSQYDVVIGGHTHEDRYADRRHAADPDGQRPAEHRRDDRTDEGNKVAGVDYRIVPLADYEPDILYQKQVEATMPTRPEQTRRGCSAPPTSGGLPTDAAAVADEADAGLRHQRAP